MGILTGNVQGWLQINIAPLASPFPIVFPPPLFLFGPYTLGPSLLKYSMLSAYFFVYSNSVWILRQNIVGFVYGLAYYIHLKYC